MNNQAKDQSVSEADWQTLFQRKSAKFKGILFFGVVTLIGLIIAAIDFYPSLSHMNLFVLSGPKSEQSYALVEKIADDARKRKGKLTNFATTGVEGSLHLLRQGERLGVTKFALVPDGLKYSKPEELELVARLPRSETILFLGLDANHIRYVSDLKGMRIGIGSQGSGTALLARQLLGQKNLSGLNLELSEHTITEQVDKLLNGALDLGVFLVSKDNPLIKKALHKNLQIANFESAEAWVARFPALRVETLYAGHYDEVLLLPKTNKKVFQVDTLVLGNGSASRSDVVALLILLNETFHGFIDYNRSTPNDTGLAKSKDLLTFIDNGGPNLLDEYAPGLVNLMPPANLFHYVVVISLLMNLLSGWNRWRLYRVDSNRIKIENQIRELFGNKLTLEEIKLDQHINVEVEKSLLNELIIQSEQLLQRCRKYTVSTVTPLGDENIYRYHEGLIKKQLVILRDLCERNNLKAI
ncbi:MAG: TAXI family TRAP transporter solute-binding subunit [Methyloprofundus sp.]|uniref:TAXI family TRAP transporter solute-binding subunit n=1 Tax=Methyloprofundus sp. TaxID=2020875 RepID=UPI001A174C1F|nr:TAXI family TRAP transporter solute-binding subunit [Methyloprofundus sp.]HIL79073.1 hypothetical protein [Methylococcales bacterium]